MSQVSLSFLEKLGKRLGGLSYQIVEETFLS